MATPDKSRPVLAGVVLASAILVGGYLAARGPTTAPRRAELVVPSATSMVPARLTEELTYDGREREPDENRDELKP